LLAAANTPDILQFCCQKQNRPTKINHSPCFGQTPKKLVKPSKEQKPALLNTAFPQHFPSNETS
jgi:hypothetical protein